MFSNLKKTIVQRLLLIECEETARYAYRRFRSPLQVPLCGIFVRMGPRPKGPQAIDQIPAGVTLILWKIT